MFALSAVLRLRIQKSYDVSFLALEALDKKNEKRGATFEAAYAKETEDTKQLQSQEETGDCSLALDSERKKIKGGFRKCTTQINLPFMTRSVTDRMAVQTSKQVFLLLRQMEETNLLI